ncbi:MAG: MarR family transcriptional regulator [Candidatus Hodarchaeales archaeon]|jgi:DNA-binding transcriptional regulator GbsR (MarR family)
MLDSTKNEEAPDILKLEEEISNFFEDLMYDWGGSPLLGRIYALCVLSIPNKPLLQKDLVERFNVNPSTISRNLKELENWRLIDRRREPGSREWKYQVEDTSFLELLVYKFDQNVNSLRDRGDDLKRIRNHWGETLSKKSKETLKGKHALLALDRLIEWIDITDKELDDFIQKLHKRYLELEKKFEKI